jgi:hypothetical protein
MQNRVCSIGASAGSLIINDHGNPKKAAPEAGAQHKLATTAETAKIFAI